MPIILIGIGFTFFLVFTNPIYSDIGQLKLQTASYNDALNNSKTLENERDKLAAKYNAIDPNNLLKLQKLLPENVDNIRLILEIEQLASPYNMVLKNIKYSAVADTKNSPNPSPSPSPSPFPNIQIQGGSLSTEETNKDYGVWDLEFSTISTYSNFLNFTKDLENNLRIVDVSSIQFSSSAVNTGTGNTAPLIEMYQYNFKIRTYWLKN